MGENDGYPPHYFQYITEGKFLSKKNSSLTTFEIV